MIDLLPCPFCGGEPTLNVIHECEDGAGEVEFAYVYCSHCGTQRGERPSEFTARQAWNLRAPAQAAWMPIETAPKDKTTILIAGGEFEWSNSMHGWMKAEGVSMASYDESEKCWRGENSGGHDEYYWHKPTHWMPLPTPPLSSTHSLPHPFRRCPIDEKACDCLRPCTVSPAERGGAA